MKRAYKLFSLNNKYVAPFCTNITLEGRNVSTEIDTGEAVFVMSEHDF